MTYLDTLKTPEKRRRHFELAGARLYRTGGPEYRCITGLRKIIAESPVMTEADAQAMRWGWGAQRAKEKASAKGR